MAAEARKGNRLSQDTKLHVGATGAPPWQWGYSENDDDDEDDDDNEDYSGWSRPDNDHDNDKWPGYSKWSDWGAAGSASTA